LFDGFNVLRQSVQEADNRNIPWIFLGDLKHIKGTWNQHALNEARRILCQEYKGVPKLLVHGNHDGVAGGSGLLPFATAENIVVSGPPTSVYFAGEMFAVWPDGKHDAVTISDALKDAREKGARILVGHTFIANSVVGPHDRPLIQGYTLADLRMEEGREMFDWAFFGDVHKRQVVPGSKRVIYPGSPLALNWGELEQDKGILLVDTESKRPVDVIPIKAPRFRIIDLTSLSLQDAESKLEHALNWEGDFVKLLAGPEIPSVLVEEFRRKSNARWFKEFTVRNKPDAETRSAIHAGMSQEQVIDEYLRVRPPDSAVDNSMLRLAGLKLLEG
jgi:DNA repair exonuclease SbcCD nuclease subunit